MLPSAAGFTQSSVVLFIRNVLSFHLLSSECEQFHQAVIYCIRQGEGNVSRFNFSLKGASSQPWWWRASPLLIEPFPYGNPFHSYFFVYGDSLEFARTTWHSPHKSQRQQLFITFIYIAATFDLSSTTAVC